MKTLFVLLIFSPIFLGICNGVSVSGLNSLETGELDVMMRKVCAGKIGECGVEAEELQVDSESNRRVLVMQKKYISYETLKRDLVPCSRPGASYYNCKPPGQANPYNRGCDAITHCARSISDIRS
ncbi:rapid alkalinization factor [Diospyros lotus]|uniref:rapid alkalinization factor n=1 Tax=Diospyros lotus TaxID=55363 RepID=UPI00224F44F0|nr:rapid alkalinization factor [Diospyros lotus]